MHNILPDNNKKIDDTYCVMYEECKNVINEILCYSNMLNENNIAEINREMNISKKRIDNITIKKTCLSKCKIDNTYKCKLKNISECFGIKIKLI